MNTNLTIIKPILRCLVFAIISVSPLVAQNLPSGFTLKKIANPIKGPTTMTVAPDGRIFICRQAGEIRVVKNDVLLTTPALKITVDSTNERGLIGIVLDPNFATNQYVYLYHTLTTSTRRNRISRYTFNGDIINAASEVIILDLDPLVKTNHNGGAMAFGPDGMLYVAVGNNNDDGGDSTFVNPNSQNLDTYFGKLLRINPADGTPPAGNPFTSGTAQKLRIWAYGLRNPYSIDVHPSGKIFVNDVGNKAFEEVNNVTTGGNNYGWPRKEGFSTNPLYTNPVFDYQNVSIAGTAGDGIGCAITGGVFFNPVSTSYPSTYQNKYFYLDWCNGWINYIDHTLANPVGNPFATNLPVTPGTPYSYTNSAKNVILKVGIDGSLYFLNGSNYSGTTIGALYKIEHSNQLPTVSMTSPSGSTIGCQGTSITLTAAASDADGTISKVDFYDGTTLLSTVTTSPYTYLWTNIGAGNHSITAKATDNANATSTSSAVSININATPSAPGVVTPVNYCQNATASVLTATGSSLQWYTVPTNGTSSTAPTPSTTTIGTTSYYVSQSSLGCESARAMIAVTVNAIPLAPGVTTSITYCQNATGTALTATGTNLKWYTVPTNGTGLTTAPTPSTTATGTTSYYVSQTVNGCESARSTIAVTVNTVPSAPGASTPVNYCQNATANTLTASGTSLLWYTVSTGGTGAASAPTPLTTATGTTSYYVSQTTNGCESSRATIAVTVYAIPSEPGVSTPVNYCQNATATALTATGTALNWYTVPTNGTSSSAAPTPSTAATGTTSYYVSQTTNGCESTRAMIAVTVNAIPSAPGVSTPVNYCQNATATALTATGTALKWYTVPTNGTSSTTLTPSTTTAGTTSYYVSQTTNGCESARATIAVTVNAVPSAPGVAPLVTYCQNVTASALTSTGTALLWYTAPTSGTGSSTAPTPSTTTTGTTSYYVSQTTSGCESARSTIAVTVNAVPSAPGVSTPVSYCQNATASALTATGTNLQWYTVSSSGTGSATAPTPSTATVGTTSYYVSQITSGCESARATIGVVVNSIPTASITAGGPTTFIQGGSVLLSANTGTGLTYRWLNGPAQVGTGSTYTATTGGSYTVEVTNTSNCKVTSSPIVVTVNGNQTPTVAITAPANNATFMEPAGMTISATASDADGTISKVDFYYGTTFIGSDNSAPYSFAWTSVMAGTYSLTAVATDDLNASTTSSAITVIVTANEVPAVSITSPLNNATFTSIANVTITATATDADGTITKVEFYHGSTLLGTDLTSPYSFDFTNLSAGTYTLTAVATDNQGAVTTSMAVNIIVNPNQSSVIDIVSPTNNSTVTGPSITIDVNATDPDGSITKVEYLDGTTVIGTSTTPPYSFTWNNPTDGTHVITVRVTDSNGGVTTSAPITTTVSTGTGIISSAYGAFTHVYPNPSLEAFTVKASQGIKSLSVINMYGVEIITLQDISADQQVEIGKELAEGTYEVIIKYNSDKIEVAKLVKIK